MTVTQVIALAMQLGWAHPQAEAVARYAWNATHLGRTFSLDAALDPCASSWRGEGLVDATGILRGELHRFATVPGEPVARAPTPRAISGACVPAKDQLAFLKDAFARHYPECSILFDRGDLGALQRCWGNGRGH